MATECWKDLLLGSDGCSTLWEGSWVSPTVVVGFFGSEDNSGRESEVVNIEYICM